MASTSLATPLISPATSSSTTTPSSSPLPNGHPNGHTNGLPHQRRTYGGAEDSSTSPSSSLAVKVDPSPAVELEGDTPFFCPTFSTSTATTHQLRLMVAALAITVVGLCLIFYAILRSQPSSSSSSSSTPPCLHTQASGTQGMVSTTHSLATKAGLDILKAGGNAFDAAAAVQFALNVVQPQSTGIGGGCFVVFYHAQDAQVYALDGREEAPAGFSEDAFCVNKTQCGLLPSGEANYCGCVRNGAYPFRDRSTGGHPVGVPGVVAAMDRLLKDYGTRSLSDVLQPAIGLAANGFPMYPEMHSRLLLNADRMLQWPGSARLFFSNGSQGPLAIGQMFTNPDLATTFRGLASNGADWFYRGRLGQDVVNTARASVNLATGAESPLTGEDLERYRAVYRYPVLSDYREWTMAGMPAPSSGGWSMAMMMNVLEQFQMNELTPQGGEWESRLIDAQDIVWADRALYMGDADWVDVPERNLLSKEYARARVVALMHPINGARIAQPGGSIPFGDPYPYRATARTTGLMQRGVGKAEDDDGFPSLSPLSPPSNPFAERYASAPESDKKGTTHLVVADRFGNVVSMTTTIEENFGSGVVVPGRGFLLNNELTDFTATPTDATGRLYANRPQGGVRARRTAALPADRGSYGGKRPMSSMSPTLMLNRSTQAVVLAMGSPGGSQIIGTVLNGVLNVVDGGMCVADAIAAPRMISQNAPSQAEDGWYAGRYDKDRTVVEERGYSVSRLVTERPLGFLEGLVIKGKNRYEGAADTTRLSVAHAEGY